MVSGVGVSATSVKQSEGKISGGVCELVDLDMDELLHIFRFVSQAHCVSCSLIVDEYGLLLYWV